MREIGTVKFVQIQQASLKQNLEDGTRLYNPSPLVKLPQIRLTQHGVVGITSDGTEIIDVHNTRHPNSRHRGDNPISIGLISHYNKMRDKFGEHIADGIAGENILVDCDEVYTSDAIGSQLAIKMTDGNIICLKEVIPIPPCEPFSRFATGKNLAPSETKSTLQFLSNGTRGFYMELPNNTHDAIIEAGNVVYLVED